MRFLIDLAADLEKSERVRWRSGNSLVLGSRACEGSRVGVEARGWIESVTDIDTHPQLRFSVLVAAAHDVDFSAAQDMTVYYVAQLSWETE